MATDSTHPVEEAILGRYLSRTPASREMDARARKRLPGGETRTATYYRPYAAYMVQGDACRLTDLDGNHYIDFLNNYTSLIHGHAHPATVAAAQAQLVRGSVLGSPSDAAVAHAEHLCGRLPSLEMVRYCNSGSEATLFAIRAARGFTGRDGIVKIDGGYHGSHDQVEVSIIPDRDASALPRGHLESRGIPARVLDDVWVVPFNDLDAMEVVLRKNGDRIAALLIEPIPASGGHIYPKPGYLKGLRALADRWGALLVFDEIVTFRLDVGGLQSLHDVRPDLTALGKIVGGGFAVGAFGGRRDVMAPFDPFHERTMNQSGTFNGNNITMAAGLATLQAYDASQVYVVNRLGDRLRQGFNQAFRSAGILGQATGFGSLVQVHWQEGEMENVRDVLAGMVAAGDVPRLFHLEMLNRGVLAAPRGQYCTSTPMTDAEIDHCIEAFRRTLDVLKPYATDRLPHLLSR